MFFNKKTTCHQSHRHDSKAEASYCDELNLRKKAGEIRDYSAGTTFILLPKLITLDKKTLPAVKFTPDFLIFHFDETIEIIDVKSANGYTTAVFRLKWRMLMSLLDKSPHIYFFTIVKR